MRLSFRSQGPTLVALAVAGLLAGCGPSRAELQAEEMRVASIAAAQEAAAIAARLPPPVALNDSVAQSAAVYLTFTRDMATVRGGFASPAAVQAALRRGASYDANQISRGLVAYASILALQSPEFVSGVRQAGAEPSVRRQIIDRIVANPEYASTLPGAEAAASLIMAVLEADIVALSSAADSVESDAYNIQYTGDQRNGWGRATPADREGRLQAIKDLSRPVAPSSSETARLYAASNSGSGLGVTAGRTRRAPYAPSVTNAIAMAGLAALGAAGDNARANTDALQYDRASQDCLASSKLNLFQCLAAARPTYEDMFCLGRHVIRDLSTCARGAALPAAIITVGNPTQSGARSPAPTRSPAITPEPLQPSTPLEPSIVPTPFQAAPTPPAAPRPAPVAPAPGQSATQRLNSGPNG
ncbi:hypothetical protein [Brevundimonas sp.]|uniref:hypothetical protein n=1 Tax=Brevundimonas sp. TaxID=1871086 RepID=UPI00286C77BC|nr:hypothetical protein [Brevundimonas sp.]